MRLLQYGDNQMSVRSWGRVWVDEKREQVGYAVMNGVKKIVRTCLFEVECFRKLMLPKFAYDSLDFTLFPSQYIFHHILAMASRLRNATCPACLKNFTHTGFQSHLRQTKDPHCAALYTDMLVDQEAPEKMPDSYEHQPFEGDTFGSLDDYRDDDFGQSHDLESGCIEDDDEQDEANSENGWEPERPGAQAANALQIEEPDPQQTGDHNEPATNIISRSQAEARITEDHVIIHFSDKHPDHQPGVPITKKRSGDDNYRTALNDSSNLWAPFSSQMDWEIAKWAKLRGAGSTAFSDLLAIEGVSISSYCGSTCCTGIVLT